MNPVNTQIISKLSDKNIRSKLLAATPDLSVLEEVGLSVSSNVDVNIVASTKDTTYIVIPNDSIDLENVSAAAAIGLGSSSSVSTICSSIGSASTAGSAIMI